ncbi:SDR family NAD(P)-dependent oxidoreductase [Atopomonas sediminilitoris]|uniref:SDR family NAD(P)-dependent oxidoreductase n=1 Tax=Atopomonas sediminilitoris TaxID=2919919 RepID=UPI001F4E883F|nr:SDR family NAD(P)-dependent oxidoreductase [Atopomonas sediminilitoris]MCJ8168310.1 SDR family NAD(P)-dependent oxidoreductase [Atopomonas sediminilitoris]
MPVTLITGAASGLGWALAQACHARGDDLLLTDLNHDLLEQRRLSLASPRVTTLAGDICDSSVQTELINTCLSQFGRLDTLINNAGITHRSLAQRTQAKVLRKVMAVNYHAPLELTLLALPLLKASRGSVIAIGSMASWMPVLGRAGYCAAKSALAQAFEVLRGEVRRDGVRVLLVYPSFLATPIEHNALGGDGQPAQQARSLVGKVNSAEWMATGILKAQQQGRERLFPDRKTWLASLLWRLAPSFFHRQMCRQFAAELS